MNNTELKNQFKLRDRVIRALSKDGKYRIAIIKNTQSVRTASENHNLPVIPARYLAKAMSASSLLAAFLKGEERIIIDIDSTGPISKIFAEAMQIGEIRGFVRYDSNLFNKAITGDNTYLAGGTFKVARVLYNKSEPVTGIIPLTDGDISSELSYYLRQSEQIASFVRLDVEIDSSNQIRQSGGLIIQAMPGTSKAEFNSLNEKLKSIPGLTKIFNDEPDLGNILQKILPLEFEIVKSSPVDFFCRCSKEKFIDKLVLLGREEIMQMEKDKQHELVCQYCNKKYYLTNEDFTKIKAEIEAKTN